MYQSVRASPKQGHSGPVEQRFQSSRIAAKIDSIPHLNNSTPLVDPSVYGYGVQKRPLDDGVGNQLGALVHQRQAKRLLGQIVDRCRNGPGFHNDMDGNSTVQELLIPASKVGLVIGKGGETIKQLQERTGVKMVMIQDGPLPTGADKPLRITGDPFKVQVSVPRFAVGIVIGRNGEMIKKIQNDAGVRIQFKPDDGISPERAAQVMGPPDRCQHAAHVISELILTAQERDGFGGLAVARGRGRGRGDWSVGTPGGFQEITYTVPADKCGLVIGKGGENIKSINQQSGAHVELQRNPPPNTDPGLRIFTIRGIPQQIEVARHLIDEKVGVRQQRQPQSSQPDYSKAWEDYYKKQSHAASAAPQASSPPDYTMAWAEYYRQQVAFYGQTLGQAQAHSQVCSQALALFTLPSQPRTLSQACCICPILGWDPRGGGTAQTLCPASGQSWCCGSLSPSGQAGHCTQGL
ncbi:Far upstream element-binding protein 3 [Tupaia chinensis]|uniref:Far upstream element-binding protein 3 n=1 Tax=Tupaia chinensis TaxID=246437 RepID=L8Y684_TUPCH|nr:Far upstream element-binding protein 3 [Tupaia chinensis]